MTYAAFGSLRKNIRPAAMGLEHYCTRAYYYYVIQNRISAHNSIMYVIYYIYRQSMHILKTVC